MERICWRLRRVAGTTPQPGSPRPRRKQSPEKRSCCSGKAPAAQGGAYHLVGTAGAGSHSRRSEEHTSELQSLMRNSYAVFRLKTKKQPDTTTNTLSKYNPKQINTY